MKKIFQKFPVEIQGGILIILAFIIIGPNDILVPIIARDSGLWQFHFCRSLIAIALMTLLMVFDALNSKKWTDKQITTALLRSMDQQGYAREDEWAPGQSTFPPVHKKSYLPLNMKGEKNKIDQILERINGSGEINEEQIIILLISQ